MSVFGNDNNVKPIDILVATPQGKLLGRTAGSCYEIQVFKEIPYALPPVGNRRWTPPEPLFIGKTLLAAIPSLCKRWVGFVWVKITHGNGWYQRQSMMNIAEVS